MTSPGDEVDPVSTPLLETGPETLPPDEPQSAPTSDDIDPFDVDAAAALSLARSRSEALSRGLRPGVVPKRRRRRVDATYSVDGGRDPHLLGEEVQALTSGRGWEVDVAAGSIMGRWPQIVGPEVAAHTAPVTFEDGVLTVRADSSAWAGNLRLMSSMLLGRLAEETGKDTVTQLKVVGPAAPSWQKGPRRTSYGRGPRDTYG